MYIIRPQFFALHINNNNNNIKSSYIVLIHTQTDVHKQSVYITVVVVVTRGRTCSHTSLHSDMNVGTP